MSDEEDGSEYETDSEYEDEEEEDDDDRSKVDLKKAWTYFHDVVLPHHVRVLTTCRPF